MEESFNVEPVARCSGGGGGGPPESRLDDLDAAREYIRDMDFILAKEKLINPEDGGSGLTSQEADDAESAYKAYLYLKRKYEDELLPPTQMIDRFWHAHILDTQAYHRDTQHIFGYYLHHYPYFGMRGEADHAKLLEAFGNTQRRWRDEYGHDLPGTEPKL